VQGILPAHQNKRQCHNCATEGNNYVLDTLSKFWTKKERYAITEDSRPLRNDMIKKRLDL
jgi:hypothetical protein